MAQIQILATEIVNPGKADAYTVATVLSPSGSSYRVDVTNRRCSCPAWKFQRKSSQGARPLCKHLISMGYKETVSA